MRYTIIFSLCCIIAVQGISLHTLKVNELKQAYKLGTIHNQREMLSRSKAEFRYICRCDSIEFEYYLTHRVN